MIRINNVGNRWNDIFALKEISLQIKKGEYFVILGPTGAGKTLLLEIIAGIYYPESGNIEIEGIDVTDMPPEKRNTGFLYQDYSLFPNYNARSNIEYGLSVRKASKEEKDGAIRKLSSMLGISHLLDRDVTTLSGGEQQKVAMARALAIKPKLLLLDEPFSALDEATKGVLIDEMKTLHKKERITTIHVTHSQEEAMLLADRIAIMMDGRIVQVGKPTDIFFKPKSFEIAKFVKIENIWNVKVIKSTEESLLVGLDGKDIRVPPHKNISKGYARLIIRPEDIIIGSGDNTSARNRFIGKIVSIESRGFYNMVRIDCGFPVVAAVTKQSIEDLCLETGKEVGVFFKTTALHIIKR